MEAVNKWTNIRNLQFKIQFRKLIYKGIAQLLNSTIDNFKSISKPFNVRSLLAVHQITSVFVWPTSICLIFFRHIKTSLQTTIVEWLSSLVGEYTLQVSEHSAYNTMLVQVFIMNYYWWLRHISEKTLSFLAAMMRYAYDKMSIQNTKLTKWIIVLNFPHSY